MIISLILISSYLFMFLLHPLSLGIILLAQTTFIAMLTGLLNSSFWFSYILFLIIIGGLMILFIYMTSIASNEKFKFSFKILMYLLIFIIIYFSFYFFMNIKLNTNFNKNIFILALNKYINSPMIISFNLIIIYLLITLIAVVNLTLTFSGPLRQLT